jgi:hypothetical protein
MLLPIFCPAQTKQPLDQSLRDGRRAKLLPGNVALSRQHIPNIGFPPDRRSTLAGDVSTGNFRPIVPLKFRKTIFNHFFNVAHPGRLASRRIISPISSDVTAWARGCLACQQGKIHCYTRLAPQPIPIPQRRFYHLHVDLVGPLQYSNNFNYMD